MTARIEWLTLNIKYSIFNSFKLKELLMEKVLGTIGSLLYSTRILMSVFYVGLISVIAGVILKFVKELYLLHISIFFSDIKKIDIIIKVLELVDMVMVAQLVFVVAVAGMSLFVTSGHFDNNPSIKKPDWLDHVNTYNLKLKLAFAIISISGVHALKVYLQNDGDMESLFPIAVVHLIFVISADRKSVV